MELLELYRDLKGAKKFLNFPVCIFLYENINILKLIFSNEKILKDWRNKKRKYLNENWVDFGQRFRLGVGLETIASGRSYEASMKRSYPGNTENDFIFYQKLILPEILTKKPKNDLITI